MLGNLFLSAMREHLADQKAKLLKVYIFDFNKLFSILL